MRELVYYVATSLDGRIAGPDGGFDMFPVEGDHIDAIVRDWTDTIPGVGLDALGLEADNSRFTAAVMGWDTYASGLPVTDDPYPHLEQVVFSRRPESRRVPGSITLTDRDPIDVVRELKRRGDGDIWLAGGGSLAGQLIEEIDRLVLKVNPFVLGDGIGLFAGTPFDVRRFALTSSTPYDSGVVFNDYRRPGPHRTTV